jgi:hypothetical protein
LAIALSFLLWFTDYDYLFGIFWPLCCLSFFDLRIMIIPLVSFGHCVVCPSLIYGLWLSLWYLLAIALSVLWFTDYDYPFGIFWPLCCLSFFDLRIMIIPLVSFGYCVVCPLIYGLWFSLWYLLAIVLTVLLWFTDYDYPFSIFWPLRCVSFDLRIMIIPLVSFGHCVVCPSLIYGLWLSLWCLLAIVLSVLLWLTDYDYPFSIFWPLRCLSFDLRIMIIPLVFFGHCVVCPLIYGLWLPFSIFWPLCCLSFFDLRMMIIPLVSFGHCVVCPSLIYGLWLSLWYLLAIVLSVLWFRDYDYPFSIFWLLCCLSFFDLRIMIIPLVSFGHCVVCHCQFLGVCQWKHRYQIWCARRVSGITVIRYAQSQNI